MDTPRQLVLCSVLLLLAATGCTAAPVGEAAQAIINGARDDGDPQALLIGISTPNGSGISQFCSAVVVSPHVVLSAAHCISPAAVGDNAGFYLYLGVDLNDPSQINLPENNVGVKEVHADPEWTPNARGQGHDVGVLITSGAITVPPMPLQRRPLSEAIVGHPVRVLGYGQTDPANPDRFGLREATETTISQINDGEILVGADGHQGCEGDSGGPTLLVDDDGVEHVAGIHSWGIHQKTCVDGGWDTRVDRHLELIDGYISMFDPGVVPMPDLAPAEMDGGTTGQGSSSGCSIGSAAHARDLSALGILVAVAVAASRRRRPTRWPLRRTVPL